MEQINVYSGKKVISRIITADNIKGLGRCLEPFRHVFAVVDRSVAVGCPAVASLISEGLGLDTASGRNPVSASGKCNAPSKRPMKVKRIEASEESKTMDTVMEICAWLLENDADRDALVLAIGGGITTDMAGFAASIYKRGVRFAYVPTTLLSQVDAAIGGKTGVNIERNKNILRVIRQPELT